MALRKASSYSRKKVRPYTRKSSKKSKAFIRAVPFSKIVKFNIGNIKGFNDGKHKYRVRMVSEEKVQVRDNAIESCRMFVTKMLDTKIPGNYFFAVKIFPHHILRENKLAAGAGADRLSSGMRHSFGITVGRAAIVPPGKDLFVVTTVDERSAKIARDALDMIRSKIPSRKKIIFEKIE